MKYYKVNRKFGIECIEIEKEEFLKSILLSDILNFNTKGFGSALIKWGTNSEVNHSAIYVGGGNNNIIEATMKHGVKKTDLKDYLDNKKVIKINVLRKDDLKLYQAEKIKQYAYSRLNTAYDKLQIIGLAIRLGIKKILNKTFFWKRNLLDQSKKDICSELVYNAYQAAQIELVSQKDESLVTPEDIEKSKYLTLMYFAKNKG